MIHKAPNTSSTIVSKSISKMVKSSIVVSFILDVKQKVRVLTLNDTLILDNESTSDTIPQHEVFNDNISLEHEAKVLKYLKNNYSIS